VSLGSGLMRVETGQPCVRRVGLATRAPLTTLRICGTMDESFIRCLDHSQLALFLETTESICCSIGITVMDSGLQKICVSL